MIIWKNLQSLISINYFAGLETETITIKQENGVLLQYELPIEHEPAISWSNTLKKAGHNAVITKAPEPRRRGRPRKYPNEQGQMGKILYLKLHWHII